MLRRNKNMTENDPIARQSQIVPTILRMNETVDQLFVLLEPILSNVPHQDIRPVEKSDTKLMSDLNSLKDRLIDLKELIRL